MELHGVVQPQLPVAGRYVLFAPGAGDPVVEDERPFFEGRRNIRPDRLFTRNGDAHGQQGGRDGEGFPHLFFRGEDLFVFVADLRGGENAVVDFQIVVGGLPLGIDLPAAEKVDLHPRPADGFGEFRIFLEDLFLSRSRLGRLAVHIELHALCVPGAVDLVPLARLPSGFRQSDGMTVRTVADRKPERIRRHVLVDDQPVFRIARTHFEEGLEMADRAHFPVDRFDPEGDGPLTGIEIPGMGVPDELPVVEEDGVAFPFGAVVHPQLELGPDAQRLRFRILDEIGDRRVLVETCVQQQSRFGRSQNRRRQRKKR